MPLTLIQRAPAPLSDAKRARPDLWMMPILLWVCSDFEGPNVMT